MDDINSCNYVLKYINVLSHSKAVIVDFTQYLNIFISACDPYTFGKDCKELCHNCRHNKPCNVVTGACINECGPGWIGDKCDQSKYTVCTYLCRGWSIPSCASLYGLSL